MLTDLSRARNAGRFGNKAANLSRLLQFGLPTPAGVVIPDSAHQAHLRRAGVLGEIARLHARLDRMTPQEAEGCGLALRARVLATPLHGRLQRALERHYEGHWQDQAVVVRSSAVGEDGRGASFAGQLESVLNIRSSSGLAEAIRHTWGSLWSPRALLYARHFGIRLLRMGVVVQEQVNARLSGVLFTRDPSGRHVDGMVLEYCAGLGDALVSGAVDPVRLIIDRGNLAIHAETPPSESGDLDPRDRAAITRLVATALELEARLGGAQDIEWCIDQGHRLILLQARPVTRLDDSTQAGSARVFQWSNANIAENYPDVVTPFLFSIVKPAYTAYFRSIGRGLGLSDARLESRSTELENIVGQHAGRLYYNVTNIHALQQLVPGGRYLNRSFNLFVGTHAVTPRQPAALGAPWQAVRMACLATWRHLRLEQGIRRFERLIDGFTETTHPHLLATKSAREIAGDLRAFLDIRMHHWRDAGLADNAAMVCYGMLRDRLARMNSHASEPTLHNSLLKGLPGLASIVPVRELWKLSRKIRVEPALAALFRDASCDGIAAEIMAPEFAAFRGEFDRYLDRWGFRFSGELMLTTPTPRENPLPVLRLLQTYANESGPDPDALIAAQARSREAMIDSLARKLTPSIIWRSMPLLSRASWFRLLLRATHAVVRFRERARMKQALLYTRLRHIALAAGERLVERSLLGDRDDVFMLTVDEVLSALEGECAANEELAVRVDARRRQLEADTGLGPPDHLALRRDEHWMQPVQEDLPAAPSCDGSYLAGLGASGGIVTGEAAVLSGVAQADRLRAGQILITRQTDPGWAAVFFLARGLVVERGGMLSHGAIIAREYGIPAVIGVASATRLIRDGDRVDVDGNIGRVRVHHE